MTTRYTEARNAIDAPGAVGSPVELPVRPLQIAEALCAYQQGDADGVMVLVSRQACDEAAALLVHQAKELDYLRACREDRKPAWVPARVWLAGPVRGDYPIGHRTIAHEGEYECQSNRYGAVSVRAENGQWLGVKPSEFEVVAWRENKA